MSKIITVFGATGNQGGSVIDSILSDTALASEFTIRGVTRDTTKPAAKALADRGVQVVSADMSSPSSLAAVVSGAHTVFLVTNYWDAAAGATSHGPGVEELTQGKAVVDAAKAAGVQHLIFSSLLNITELTNGRLTHLKHFDGKAQIEQYARDSGVPSTFVLAGFFMSNFFSALRKGDDGSYTMALPVNCDKAQLPVFDTPADMGKFAKAAIKHFPEYTGKRIYAATEYMSPNEVVAQFTQVTGKPAKAIQVPDETYKSFLPAPIAQEMLENFKLLEEPGYYGGVDLKESLSLLDEKPVTLKEWLVKTQEKW
ncbi:hypothetical protein B0I35DRAFT_406073 [Stachybotrys elegans]|uniref:NmrA-like domain-containing protein n=1 Tax=Stachybotrys elegans TaxID=80388 RepID=A0A8K0WTG7_9HYPO|nr:hypothetical protein B0I35DRAFT_406073 [Stachybotrys elegans]